MENAKTQEEFNLLKAEYERNLFAAKVAARLNESLAAGDLLPGDSVAAA